MDIALKARVSSHRQEREETVQTQLDYLRRWADLNGHNIVDVYADEAVSGTIPVADRLEGGRLLEDAGKGRFQAVVVYRLDRLGRSVKVVYDALDRLNECKVAFISATEPFDTSTPFGKIIMGFLALFAEFEKEAIAQRCADGQRKAFREGGWAGGRTNYGFAIEGNRLAIDPEAAQVVMEIFQRYVKEQISFSRMAYDLTLRGIPPPAAYRGEERGERGRWHACTVHRIIKHPAYRGEYAWGEFACAAPALIPDDLWQAAQERVEEAKKFSQRDGEGYLLSGLIHCGDCGRAFQGTTWKNGRKMKSGHTYVCRNRCQSRNMRGAGVPRCKAPYVDAPRCEAQILATCWRVVENPDYFRELLEEQRGEGGDSADRLQQEQRQLQAARAERREERARLLHLYRKGRLSEEEWDQQEREITEEEEGIARGIGELQARLEALAAGRRHLDDLEEWMAAIRASNPTDREVVRKLVKSITAIADEEGRPRLLVTYWMGEPNEGAASPSLSRSQPRTLTLTLAYPRLAA